MGKKRKKVPGKVREAEELLYWGWTIIANAYGGDWSQATPEWRDAASSWRDVFHRHLDGRPLPALVEEEG